MTDVISTSKGHVIPNIGLVVLPAYLYRNNKARSWIVKCGPLGVHKTFTDGVLGGTTNAFYAAWAYHQKEIFGALVHGTRVPKRKASQKIHDTGVVGINYMRTVNRKTDKAYHTLRVSCMEGNFVWIYLGSDDNYLDYYEAGLARATAARNKAIVDYCKRHKWIGFNPDLYKNLKLAKAA